MQLHIPDIDLDRLVHAPDTLTEEQADLIAAHVQACALCRENLEAKRTYKALLEETLRSEPTRRDHEIASRYVPEPGLLKITDNRLAKTDGIDDIWIPPGYSSIQILRLGIVRFVRQHPVITSGTALAIAAALGLLFFSLRPQKGDMNPAFAKVENYLLTAFNAQSEIIWTKNIIGLRNCTSEYYLQDGPGGKKRQILLGDIDDDGFNEIVALAPGNMERMISDSLQCFEHDGNIRWKIGLGKIISFGDTAIMQHDAHFIHDFLSLKRTPGSKTQLFIAGSEINFSPSKVLEVDPRTGSELQAYYNRGGSGFLLTRDIDRDGINDILYIGINDVFNNAFLAVLDPARINGYAPLTQRYLPVGIFRAIEKYYVLFPKTFLHDRWSNETYNFPVGFRITASGQILCTIKENLYQLPESASELSTVFVLDDSLNVVSIAAGDDFLKVQSFLLSKGLLAKAVLPGYLDELKRSVQYWDGEKFVKYRTGNKYYTLP